MSEAAKSFALQNVDAMNNVLNIKKWVLMNGTTNKNDFSNTGNAMVDMLENYDIQQKRRLSAFFTGDKLIHGLRKWEMAKYTKEYIEYQNNKLNKYKKQLFVLQEENRILSENIRIIQQFIDEHKPLEIEVGKLYEVTKNCNCEIMKKRKHFMVLV